MATTSSYVLQRRANPELRDTADYLRIYRAEEKRQRKAKKLIANSNRHRDK